MPAKILDMPRPGYLAPYVNRTQVCEARIQHQLLQFQIQTDCVDPETLVVSDP